MYQKCDQDCCRDVAYKQIGHDGDRLISVVGVPLEFCQFYHDDLDDELEGHDDEGNCHLVD